MTQPPKLGDLIEIIENMHPDGDPLKKLSDAVYLAQRVNELADHLIGHFVDRARHAGASWTEIGQNMGVTKQAAQKRFTLKSPDQPNLSDFARFTDRARSATVASQVEAKALKHDSIEPGHIVLGLLHEPEGLAGRVMLAAAKSPDTIREAVLAKLGPATDYQNEHIPFSGASKKVLELTVREALRLGHNYVGTEHILLGILAVGDDTLTGLGITADMVEAAISAMQQTRQEG